MSAKHLRQWWSTDIPNVTIGLDLGDRVVALCRLDHAAAVVERRTLTTTSAALERYFAGLAPARVVLEAGTHSPWISRLLESLGHEVIVANPTKLRGKGTRRKSDRIDAEYLARQGRADPALLFPIRHRGEAAQADLVTISARDALVKSRTLLINQVRGSVKSLGGRLPSCSSESFERTAATHLPDLLRRALLPLLEMIRSLTQQIRAMDHHIEAKCAQEYPETRSIRQVAGVGPLTALGYGLVLEDRARFPDSRSVGGYLGLVPRLEETGGKGGGPELSISKAGHRLLRRLLVQAAHYIVGPFGPDTDLRRWGLALAGRGGKNAKKRAVIAVARKLAVLLHRLWVTQERYEPLLNAQRVTAPAARGWSPAPGAVALGGGPRRGSPR